MHNKWIDLSAVLKIIGVGLLCGAGLPALFAIGLRALATTGKAAVARHADSDRVYGGSVPGLLIAVVCFAVVLAAIGYGIDIIVATS